MEIGLHCVRHSATCWPMPSVIPQKGPLSAYAVGSKVNGYGWQWRIRGLEFVSRIKIEFSSDSGEVIRAKVASKVAVDSV